VSRRITIVAASIIIPAAVAGIILAIISNSFMACVFATCAGLALASVGLQSASVRPWRWLAFGAFAACSVSMRGMKKMAVVARGVAGLARKASGQFQVASHPVPPSTALEAVALLRAPLEIALGIGASGRAVVVDLSGSHTLVAGSTGAGKTNLLNVVLMQLMARHAFGKVAVHVIDMKGDTEDGLAEWRPLLASYVSEVDEVRGALFGLVAEMESRHRAQAEDRPAIVLIVDELADATDDVGCRKALNILARRGRSAGMSLVVATQHPTAAVLDTQMARNLTRKVMLPVDNATQARVVMADSLPDGFVLPTRPGEFVVRDRERRFERGMAWRVDADAVRSLAAQLLEGSDDPLVRLMVRHWHTRAGVKRMASETGLTQRQVWDTYRWLAEIGVFAQESKGHGYGWAMPLAEGIMAARRARDAGPSRRDVGVP